MQVGDTGKVTEDLRSVGQQMARWRAKANASFVLLHGDNFYENGVASVADPLWQSTFFDVFPEADFPVSERMGGVVTLSERASHDDGHCSENKGRFIKAASSTVA